MVDLSSPVADLRPVCRCDLGCKWVTKKPSCNRTKKDLLEYFGKHGRFEIARREYVKGKPRCPLFEKG